MHQLVLQNHSSGYSFGVLHINSTYGILLQALDTSLQSIPRDRSGKLSKQYLRVALDILAPSSGLPPVGGVDEVISLSRLGHFY